jgi:hypothetical protein
VNELQINSVLLAHSLLQRVTAGRYDLHPLIQEFAARKVDPVAAPSLFAAHSMHYLTLLTSTEASQRPTLRIDFANIRSAWQRAVMVTDGMLIEPHVAPFGEFIMQFGGMADGNMLLPRRLTVSLGVLHKQSWSLTCLSATTGLNADQKPKVASHCSFEFSKPLCRTGRLGAS